MVRKVKRYALTNEITCGIYDNMGNDIFSLKLRGSNKRHKLGLIFSQEQERRKGI